MRAGVRRRGVALRRPGAAIAAVGSPVERWDRDEVVPLVDVPLEKLGKNQGIVVEEGSYFTGPCKIAGTIAGMEVDESGATLRMKLCGTDNDAVLRQHSGAPSGEFRVHRCPGDCAGTTTANDLIHAKKARILRGVDVEEAWTRNLDKVVPVEIVDDLAALRQRELGQPGEPSGAAQRVPGDEKTGKADKEKEEDRKSKKKKKKKKSKEKADEGEEKGSPERIALDGSQARLACTKPYSSLFKGTGLDGRERVRARVAKRARKVLKKKGDKSSSSSSDSSSSESLAAVEMAGDSLFMQGSRVRAVAEKCPGALSAQALQQMRLALLQDAGLEETQEGVKPTATQYFRQQLQRRTQGPAQRELYTLCATADLLLRGKVAMAMDVVLQRIKSSEATALGQHWATSQKMEVLEPEMLGIAGTQEMGLAQKESYYDSKVKWAAANPEGKSGGGKGSNAKGKDWRKDGKGERGLRREAADEEERKSRVDTPRSEDAIEEDDSEGALTPMAVKGADPPNMGKTYEERKEMALPPGIFDAPSVIGPGTHFQQHDGCFSKKEDGTFPPAPPPLKTGEDAQLPDGDAKDALAADVTCRLGNLSVMVSDDWPAVCTGLVRSGVCTFLPEEDVFEVDGLPLVNGLFGVSKDEISPEGYEVYRLIMNLIPLNQICEPLAGDVDTLPSWAMMNPFHLQPSECLLVSSEDVKCFFYTMRVPSCWWKYLCFNKLVPNECLPESLRGRSVYLASTVLPMGFVNSVGLAQHVHRNLVQASGEGKPGVNEAHAELRKDRPFSVANPLWRVYLDNYDLLEKVEATGMIALQETMAPGILALREQYESWDVPRNTKKTVLRSTKAEVQGATVDGCLGVAYPREAKLAKYLALGFKLTQQRFVSQKQLQVVCGGLVYFSMFRRPLLGTLNRVWSFMEEFNHVEGSHLPLPTDCRLEILRMLGLTPLAAISFRLEVDEMVTCSDASNTGGGICRSIGLTQAGTTVAGGALRGEIPQGRGDYTVLSIGLFDGIGALRVGLDLQGVSVAGHVSVERSPSARRVVEANFPGSLHVESVEEVDDEMVRSWSLRFGQVSLVVLGAGPPCQGVSGLNFDRKGALRDARSSLYTHVSRIRSLLQKHFTWAAVAALMESVASMDSCDQRHMSSDFGDSPIRLDAGCFTWCNRPRLYWTSWELQQSDVAWVSFVDNDQIAHWELAGAQRIEDVVEPGWVKVCNEQAFPTFTTARPRDHPGRKPAGLAQCDATVVARWKEDLHRFPPYQYLPKHCLINRSNSLRLPSVSEREMMLGFPLGYTSNCLPKTERKGASYNDCRLTLLGNSWSVPCVAWLLNQLLHPLGFCPEMSPQDILDACRPDGSSTIQGRLLRLPLGPQPAGSGSSLELATKLSNLVSMKGEDVMLTTPSSQMCKFHRLRASIPSRLWKWRIVTGWKWRHGAEHINALELKAVLTTVRWRVEHCHQVNKRFLHLTDSLVCLHALTRGRSSSRKLRRPLAKINALLLASRSQGFWGYVHTGQNLADKPSRWGRRVRTKFKNAKKSA
eukprot:Skav223371  [mRNA]  locus=scaffold1536:180534:185737:+ [translate_table: standard]